MTDYNSELTQNVLAEACRISLQKAIGKLVHCQHARFLKAAQEAVAHCLPNYDDNTTSLHECMYWNWAHDLCDSNCADGIEKRSVSDCHITVHKYAHEAIELIRNGDLAGACAKLQVMKAASDKVVEEIDTVMRWIHLRSKPAAHQ